MKAHRLPIQRLRSNLRDSAALMPLALGSKARTQAWRSEDNNEKLKYKNVAVIQGRSFTSKGTTIDCGGICSIDIDGSATTSAEEILEQFVGLNPEFKWTFRTAARRGCNLWFQCTGDIPKSFNLLDSDGNPCGEFRAGGRYTIVQGEHPEGMPYRVVVDLPAISMTDLAGVKWLDGRSLVDSSKPVISETGTQEAHRHKVEKRERSDRGLNHLELVASYLPTAVHTSDRTQFALAGAIKEPLTPKQAREVGGHWFDLADPAFLRPELSREDYAKEFERRFSLRKYTTGEGSEIYDQALQAALDLDAPDLVADEYPHSKPHQLIASLCRELARRSRDKAFFLSARKVCEVIESGSPKRGSEILRDLQSMRLIFKVKVHTPGKRKANEWLYLDAIGDL
jgi:hypothetical protein